MYMRKFALRTNTFILRLLFVQAGSDAEWKEEIVEDPYSDRHTIELSVEEPFRPYEVQVNIPNFFQL